MLACPPCRGLCPGGTAGASLSPDYSCSGRRCGGTLGVRGADLLHWQKRGSLGRSGSPCRARPASAQPVSAYGLGVSSHCPGTRAPSHRPAPRPTCTGIPPGRGARRPECSPTLGALCPPGCSPDWTASAVRSLGTGCMAPGWAGHWDPGMKLLPRGCPWRCPRLGGSTAGGCGLAVRGLEVRDLRGSSQDRTGRFVRVSSASGGGGRPLVWGSLLRLYEACACLRPDSTLWK